jgi:hypothetical protein
MALPKTMKTRSWNRNAAREALEAVEEEQDLKRESDAEGRADGGAEEGSTLSDH